MTGPNDSPNLDPFAEFIAAYPRKQSIGLARGRWLWALAKVNNDSQQIIDGARRAAGWHMREGTELRFIPLPHKWLDAESWLDSYELPKAPVASPREAEMARLTALADKWWPRGVSVTKFVLDWRRDRITEADKRAIVQCGIRTEEEVAA